MPLTRWADPRVADWPLMQSMWPTLFLTAAYLAIVQIGMRVMRGHQSLHFTCVCVHDYCWRHGVLFS